MCIQSVLRLENNKLVKSGSLFLWKPFRQQLINVRRLLLNNGVYSTDMLAEWPLQRGRVAVNTWCLEWQPIVQTPGLRGDEQVAEDAESDDEGEKNHSCYRETHKSTKTVKQNEYTINLLL